MSKWEGKAYHSTAAVFSPLVFWHIITLYHILLSLSSASCVLSVLLSLAAFFFPRVLSTFSPDWPLLFNLAFLCLLCHSSGFYSLIPLLCLLSHCWFSYPFSLRRLALLLDFAFLSLCRSFVFSFLHSPFLFSSPNACHLITVAFVPLPLLLKFAPHFLPLHLVITGFLICSFSAVYLCVLTLLPSALCALLLLHSPAPSLLLSVSISLCLCVLFSPPLPPLCPSSSCAGCWPKDPQHTLRTKRRCLWTIPRHSTSHTCASRLLVK